MSEERIDLEENTSKVILGDPVLSIPIETPSTSYDFYNEELDPEAIHNTAKNGKDVIIGNQIYDFGTEPIPEDDNPSGGDALLFDFVDETVDEIYDFYNEELNPDEINSTGHDGEDVPGNDLYDFGNEPQEETGEPDEIFDCDEDAPIDPPDTGFPEFTYESYEPNTNAYYAEEDVVHKMTLFNKEGDSTLMESDKTGDNAAIYICKDKKVIVDECEIHSTADHGIGIFATTAEFDSIGSYIITNSNNSPALFLFDKARYTSNADVVKTTGAISPIIKLGDRTRVSVFDTFLISTNIDSRFP